MNLKVIFKTSKMRKVKFKLSIYRTSISVDLNEFGIEGKEWNDLTEA